MWNIIARKVKFGMAVAYVTWSEQQAIETIDSTEIFRGKISAYTTYFTARPILVKDKYRVNRE